MEVCVDCAQSDVFREPRIWRLCLLVLVTLNSQLEASGPEGLQFQARIFLALFPSHRAICFVQTKHARILVVVSCERGIFRGRGRIPYSTHARIRLGS